MLTIEPPFYISSRSHDFRDTVDPDQFYYLPGTPHLARNAPTSRSSSTSTARDLPTTGPDPTRAPGAGLALFDVDLPRRGSSP